MRATALVDISLRVSRGMKCGEASFDDAGDVVRLARMPGLLEPGITLIQCETAVNSFLQRESVLRAGLFFASA